MMLYLTGASSSIAKSGEAPQDDPMKSLGGYVSTSPVPNAAINTLFDLVSMRTIKDKTKETIAIALVNKFDYAVSEVSLKVVSEPDNVCRFRVAAVPIGDNYEMEHINNRYSEPLSADFYDATFYRASVDVEIRKAGVKGEEIVFDPFDITAVVEEGGIEGTYQAISAAFSASEKYEVKRITETKFRIESKDDTTIETPLTCSYIATDGAEFEFADKFKNVVNNEVVLTDELQPQQAIGIWLQRQVADTAEKTNEELIEDFDNGRKAGTVEEIELSINYNIVEEDTDTEEGGE